MMKTLRSRVAAVAVAALSVGLLTAAPASADPCTQGNASFCTAGFTSVRETHSVSAASGQILLDSTATTTDVSSVTVTIEGLNRPLSSTGQKDSVTLELQSTSSMFTFDTNQANSTKTNASLSFGTSHGNPAVTITAASDGATASAVIPINLGQTQLRTVGTYTGSLFVGDWASSDAGSVVYNSPVALSFKVGHVVNRTLTLSASTATAAAGTAVSFDVTDAFTANPSATSTIIPTLTVAAASGYLSAAVGTATSGNAYLDASSTASSLVINNYKEAPAGSYSVKHTITVAVPSDATPGTLVVNLTGAGGIAPSAKTFTITINPTIYSYAYAKVDVEEGTGVYATSDKTVYGSKTYTGSAVATFKVRQFKTNQDEITTGGYSKAVTATLVGVGSLANTAGAATTYKVWPAGVTAPLPVPVYADGRGGTATITFTVDGVTVATKTVKFYGAAAKVTVIPVYSIAHAGSSGYETGNIDKTTNGLFGDAGSENDPAIAVVVTDANGIPVPALTGLTVTNSDPTVLGAISLGFVDSGDGLYSAGVFAHHYTYTTVAGVASGKSTTLTFKFTNLDASVITADAITIKTGGSVAKVVLTLDKSSYTTGGAAVLTLTATDSSGNPAYDGAEALGASLVSNLAVGAALPVASAVIEAGKATFKLFAPSSSGTWTISGKDAADNVISVSATVADVDLDAVKAQVAALTNTITVIQTAIATLVASTTATLTTLTSKINKIMKKLKIK